MIPELLRGMQNLPITLGYLTMIWLFDLLGLNLNFFTPLPHYKNTPSELAPWINQERGKQIISWGEWEKSFKEVKMKECYEKCGTPLASFLSLLDFYVLYKLCVYIMS